MVSRLTTVDVVSLLLFGWQVTFPVTGLRLLSALLLLVAAATVIRLVMRELPIKTTRVLVLGSGSMTDKLLEELEANDGRRFAIVGIVADEQPDAGAKGAAQWLGAYDRLGHIVAQAKPDCIVVAVADRRERLPMQTLLEWRVKGILVEDASEFYERLTGKIAIEDLRPSALILGRGFGNSRAAERLARLVSLLAAAVALVLAAPLLAVLALAIRLDSRGPVFFIQQRAGRDGRPFGLIKFRTMHPCVEARSEWVADNADRITRVGRWLRRFRLDELPQLVNVLRGEMNLVGPRPHPSTNYDAFLERIAYYGIRSSVRPGVTGWAQVRYGYANNLDEETEKMRYDLFYIKNRSLWLDARILFETVLTCIARTDAAVLRRRAPERAAPLPDPRGGDGVVYVP